MMLEREITFGDKYDPAMKIMDQGEAEVYFEACMEHTMSWGHTREEAEGIEKANLGYWAGYYDHETRLRVERLFCCTHPIFGKAMQGTLTPEETFRIGRKWAEES